MNPEAQALLNRISEKSVAELTDSDKWFLYGRREYLGGRAQKKFAEVLKEMQKRSEAKMKEDAKNGGQPQEPVKEEVVDLSHPAEQHDDDDDGEDEEDEAVG